MNSAEVLVGTGGVQTCICVPRVPYHNKVLGSFPSQTIAVCFSVSIFDPLEKRFIDLPHRFDYEQHNLPSLHTWRSPILRL